MGQREDLLVGAKKCLVEKGYGKTTARDIAAMSGANLASIGYHFGSKDNLMNMAVLESVDEWGDALELATVDAADPQTRLQNLLDALFNSVEGRRDLQVASVQAYAQALFSEEIHRQLAASFEGGRRGLAAVVLGRQPSEIDESTAQALGSLIHSLLLGAVLQYLITPEARPTGAELIGAMRTIVGAGS